MSVFDDLKDSLHGSENSESFSNDLDSDFGSRTDGSGLNGSEPERKNIGQDRSQGRSAQRGQNSPNRNQDKRQQGRTRGQSIDSPNAQAGRPQEGSSKPQLSSQTRKKIDHAGLNQDSQRDSKQSVAVQRSDIEDLKSQNQQIIELLKRINQSLQNNNSGRHRR